jgi:two-component system, LytTR family, sensor kinase
VELVTRPLPPPAVDDRIGLPWRPFLMVLSGLALFTTLQILIAFKWVRESDLTYREAILSGAATWYPWVVLAPLVFVVCRYFRFDGATWWRSAMVHLPSSFVFGGLWTLLRWVLSFWSWIDEKPLSLERIAVAHFYLWFLAYWILVGVHEAWRNYRRFTLGELRASQLEARLAQAQLEVLKGQLHPHFLFNTLHAISTLIHRDADAADEMLAQLSDLLRMTLATVGVQEVPLQQELEFLRRYLDIQQTRFADRLKVVLDVPPDTLDIKVPNQVLQPLVENAIHHGVDARRGDGLVEIRARAEGDMLRLEVRDDGPGLKTTPGAAPKPAGTGIGLSNTRARLHELYGPKSALELANYPAGGTLVSLLIPLRRAQPEPVV